MVERGSEASFGASWVVVFSIIDQPACHGNKGVPAALSLTVWLLIIVVIQTHDTTAHLQDSD